VTRVVGFPPIVRANARVLVLGSIPGVESLRQQQYYAHPRNLFWPLAGEILGLDSTAKYSIRIRQLAAAGIALWDVLASAHRPGSLDTRIAVGTAGANDFTAFLNRHSMIQRVCFNGRKAQQLFARLAAPQLDGMRQLEFLTLPSTSPANAAISRDAKLRAWRAAFNYL
jgi:hypoxanthine-DNA glycosylase